MYAAAHAHFINALDNTVFTKFSELLNTTNSQDGIKGLKEMYVDFLVREHAVYSLDNERQFHSLFGEDVSSTVLTDQLSDIAKQILCVCVTLGENPLIRYHRPRDIQGTINRRIPEQLAKLVQEELDTFCTTNPEFPPSRDPPLPAGTLIILDRPIDPISPFLHEFTYQAMIADLLDIEEIPTGLRYQYQYTQEDGTTQNQEVILTEQDTVYTSARHQHIGPTTKNLVDDFNAFMNENKISSGGQSTAGNLNDMKNMISNLPQFQEMKSKFSAHITMANECMNQFERQNLETIGTLEQNMACGVTPEGDETKNMVEDLIPILDDPITSEMIKTRLILLWIATSDEVDPEDLANLLSFARLSQKYKDAIENISLLGVKLSKSANKQGQKAKKNKKKKDVQQDVPYDLSRYVPIVKRIVEGHINNTIDESLFPINKRKEQQKVKKDTEEAKKEGPRLRVSQTKWHKKSLGVNAGPKPPSGPPIIIFIVGGVTYSEIRSAYELAEASNREVYIGSTQVITPDAFVDSLSELHKPSPEPKELVPPYTGNIHQKGTRPVSQVDVSPRASAPHASKGHRLLKW
ncbi:Sec1-like protein [Pilobolus umbonatus]|nr:Sec1-like protein [Pilobolus umbonatus]